MILLGLGSNTRSVWGAPLDILKRAVDELDGQGVCITRRSSWYRSAPYGPVQQDDYVNGVVAVATHLSPHALLNRCRQVERRAQRVRRERWGARSLDIDVLAYHDLVLNGAANQKPPAGGRYIPLTLPHPGIADRPFVLVPLCEIAPDWRHPVTRETGRTLLERLERQHQGAILEKF